MLLPLILTPELPAWVQQLAGILPLSALIEFIDITAKLHTFELNGSVPLWSWPITPAGARLLLSTEDIRNACCLDRPTRSTNLHCIDGRHGNLYPSHTPTTTRLYMSGKKCDFSIQNGSSNMADKGRREQNLDLFMVCKHGSATPEWFSFPIGRIMDNIIRGRKFKYWLISGGGWLCLTGMAIVSLMAALYIASMYLLLMPLTGYIVHLTHGGRTRRLSLQHVPTWPRLVLVTSSVNNSQWSAFYGESLTLNALLNKQLTRSRSTPFPNVLRNLLRLIIVGQWILAVGSCARQDWNAVLISFWVLFCSCVDTYGYPPDESVQDWARIDCKFHTKRIQATFSTRRAMLSALIYLNPDTKDRRINWIDPILLDDEERSEWESTAFTLMETGSCGDETMKEKYWWKYLVEGFEVGMNIQKILSTQSKAHA